MSEAPQRDYEDDEPAEDQPGEPGAESGTESESADSLPGQPAEDDAPMGDTDQHSDA